MTHPPPRHRPCLAAGHDASLGHVAKGRNYEKDFFLQLGIIYGPCKDTLGGHQALCLVGNSSTTLVSVCWSCQVVVVNCCVFVCIRRSVARVCMVRLNVLLTLRVGCTDVHQNLPRAWVHEFTPSLASSSHESRGQRRCMAKLPPCSIHKKGRFDDAFAGCECLPSCVRVGLFTLRLSGHP